MRPDLEESSSRARSASAPYRGHIAAAPNDDNDDYDADDDQKNVERFRPGVAQDGALVQNVLHESTVMDAQNAVESSSAKPPASPKLSASEPGDVQAKPAAATTAGTVSKPTSPEIGRAHV